MNTKTFNTHKHCNIQNKLNILHRSKKLRLFLFIFICISTFFMMYMLNKNTQLTSDDYRYNYIYEAVMPTSDVEKISSFTDIMKSMYNHYNSWGGRIPAHTLVQLFLMNNKFVFNVVNSVAFVLLALLIYMHCNPSRKIKCTLLTAIILLLWFFIPQFGLTILWVSGSCNYLWCTLMILIFLLPYRFYIKETKLIKDNFISIILMFILGIISGWTNENTGGAMILLQILFLLYYRLSKKIIPKWAITGLLGAIVGFIFLIIAPGNYIREASATPTIISILKRLARALLSIIVNSYESTWGLVIILTILTIILINSNKKIKDRFKIFIVPLMYFTSAIVGIGALILSPSIPQRTWFGPVVFIIISIGCLYCKLDFNNILIKQILIACICFFSISFLSQYMIAYKDIKITYNQVIEQIQTIDKEKKLGNYEITVKKISKPQSKYNAFYGSVNLSENKEGWFNSWMAKYYNVDSIIGED